VRSDENAFLVVVDRIEGRTVVIEGHGAVPATLLPLGLKEGDVLRVRVDGARVSMTKAPLEKERAGASLQALRAELEEENGGDDEFEL